MPEVGIQWYLHVYGVVTERYSLPKTLVLVGTKIGAENNFHAKLAGTWSGLPMRAQSSALTRRYDCDALSNPTILVSRTSNACLRHMNPAFR
jgi:hypothetical protein